MTNGVQTGHGMVTITYAAPLPGFHCALGQARHLLTAHFVGEFCVNGSGVGTYHQGAVTGNGVVLSAFGFTVFSADGRDLQLAGQSFGGVCFLEETAPLHDTGPCSLG